MDPATSPDVPLFIEPLIGWRTWNLGRSRDGELRLRSVTGSDEWPAREPMHARCRKGASDHRAPALACTCGIYATEPKNLSQVAVGFATQASVVGSIAMWGTVVEHATGARSEFAYPCRLAVLCRVCLRASRMVEADMLAPTPTGIVGVCWEHGAGLQGVPARHLVRDLLEAYGVERLPLHELPVPQPVPRPKIPDPIVPTPVEPLRAPRASRQVAPIERSLKQVLLLRQQPKSTVVKWIMVLTYLPALFLLMMAGVLIAMTLVLSIAFIGYDVVRAAVSHHAPAAATSSGSAIDVPIGRSGITFDHPAMRPRAVARPDRHPSPVFPDLVCGHGEWSYVELLPCGDPRAELVGSAEPRGGMGPKKDCPAAIHTFAYSHGTGYFICWFASITEPPRVSDWPWARDPYTKQERAYLRLDRRFWRPPPPAPPYG